jgi:L-ascorbate metabolism protein UlaG (beta-lactamase superfamily)
MDLGTEILKHKKSISFTRLEIPLERYDKLALSLWWLGQAGFYLKYGNYSILIDAYLSDSLAQKYAGKEFPHLRMMPPPVNIEQFRNLDFVFCTHGHSDHMDPGSLPQLAENNPLCKFIIPKSEIKTAVERGVAENKIIGVNAGESLILRDDLKLDILSSSHEELKMNELGEYYYLGYVISLGQFTLYHSGDCIPYDGLSEKLKKINIDAALLPVNGRDNYRKERGIPGNFTFKEAALLCYECNIPNLIVHHFGMFSFNTVYEETLIQRKKKFSNEKLNIIIPETGYHYEIRKRLS